jgi:nucleotide-binding universal stress UspA family protein
VTRTALVPLDGSPLAERALPYAALLAGASRWRLVLLRAVPERGVMDAEGVQEHVRERREAARYLQDIAALVAANAGAPTPDTQIRDGAAAEVVLQQIDVQHAGLVVMATHGRSGAGRWLYGSVADEVLRGAGIPVFLVPATHAYAWPADRRPRVLVPLDGSARARAAVDPATDLATTLGADLLLVRVVDLPHVPTSVYSADPLAAYDDAEPFPDYDPAADLASARDYLEWIADPLRERGHTVAVDVRSGAAVEEIAAAARERHADVIAMGTHGRSGLARLVLGSVATGTLRRAGLPVLLVRATAAHASEETAAPSAAATAAPPIRA